MDGSSTIHGYGQLSTMRVPSAEAYGRSEATAAETQQVGFSNGTIFIVILGFNVIILCKLCHVHSTAFKKRQIYLHNCM